MLLYSIVPLYADIPWLRVDGNKIKDPEGNVVVLRGISLIDLGFLEAWQGGAINMIDRITDKNDSQGNSPGWYPKVIRIPICPADDWPYPFSADDDSLYNYLLRPVVDYCAGKDLYVIVDRHYCMDTWSEFAQVSEFWRYMAPRFANDSHVLFELFNEPINDVNGDWIGNATNDWLSVRADMQTWVDIVRSHAPYNLILVGGPIWSQAIGPAASYPIAGCNIVMVAHIYPGHWLDDDWSWWYANQIRTCAAVYPIMMTEWGFSRSSHPDPEDGLHDTITEYGQPLIDFMDGLDIGYTAWVASYDWGPPMFNRDWTLRIGEGEMGGFVKDTLYLRRHDDQPYGAVQPPIDWGCLSTEDFESRNFRKFPWEHGGDARWSTSSQERYSGRYSAESGSIEDGESSVLQVTLDCVSGDITFYRKVSSESGYDYLKFYIDGAEKGKWSGEENWAQMSFPVDEGTRTFEWTYSKDGSAADGDDTAWIDDVVFPLDINFPAPDFPEPPATNINEFDLYTDDIGPSIIASGEQEGLLDYDCQDNPAVGDYCIHWTGVGQWNAISFRFSPVKDLSKLVDEGSAIDFWVRCDSPNAKIDIRFEDTKTNDPGDHPWRMRYTIDRNVANLNGEWNHLQIPLHEFSEGGSWDNDRWYDPAGAFDWTAVERFMFVSEHHDLTGIHFYFDDIRVVEPNSPIDPQKAYNPYPSDGAQLISPNVTLNWAAAVSAVSHHVYFGDNVDDVNVADTSDTTGIYRSAQAATTYTPGLLEWDKVYYWRVDEFDGAVIHKGDVWSFGTIPEVDFTLVGWWKFDEGSGTIAYDSSGNGNDGTFNGDPRWAPDHSGYALEFDGSGDWLDCGEDPSFQITDAVTVAAWIKVSAQGIDHKIGGNQDDANGGYKMSIFSNNRVEFEIRTAANSFVLNRDVSGGTEIMVDVWYHVTGVYSLEGGHIRTYVNGVLDREMSTTEVLGASRGSFKIGCEPFATGSFNFNGVMDDLRIYNRALTEAEVLAAMEDHTGGANPNASRPKPADGALLSDTWVNLSWTPGGHALSHDVYFGDNFDDVNDGTGDTFQGNQTATRFRVGSSRRYPFASDLVAGATYYWRIDEVNDTEPNSPWKGDVWSFMTPPETASDPYPTRMWFLGGRQVSVRTCTMSTSVTILTM
jgi:endoglucanase